MTTPREEQPQTEVPATPTVTTAPPRARWRFANVPSRLGRARTSTVVLAVLFVAFFVLWIYVRPEAVATPAGEPGPVAPASSATSEAPATTTEAPTTTAPSETTGSSTATEEPTTGETTTPGPSSSTSPGSPTSVDVPTPTEPAPTS